MTLNHCGHTLIQQPYGQGMFIVLYGKDAEEVLLLIPDVVCVALCTGHLVSAVAAPLQAAPIILRIQNNCTLEGLHSNA
jgi:hypothetical protein